MGQKEVYEFMKKNPETFFSGEDIAKFVGVNISTALTVLRKLKEADDLEYKELIPSKGPVKKLFCFRVKDDYLEEIEHEFNYLKHQNKYSIWHPEQLLLMINVRELKIMNKRLEHLEVMGEEKRGKKK